MKVYQLQAKLDEVPSSAEVTFATYLPAHSIECDDCGKLEHIPSDVFEAVRAYVVDKGDGNVLIEIR